MSSLLPQDSSLLSGKSRKGSEGMIGQKFVLLITLRRFQDKRDDVVASGEARYRGVFLFSLIVIRELFMKIFQSSEFIQGLKHLENKNDIMSSRF